VVVVVPPSSPFPIVEQIGQLIAKGMTEEQACLRVGVNLNSFAQPGSAILNLNWQ